MIVTAGGNLQPSEQLDQVRAKGCAEAQGYFFCFRRIRAEKSAWRATEDFTARDTRACGV